MNYQHLELVVLIVYDPDGSLQKKNIVPWNYSLPSRQLYTRY